MPAPHPIAREHLRTALRALGQRDYAALDAHALARAARLSGRAFAKALQAAMDALAIAGAPHTILQRQYVRQDAVEAIAADLFISRRTLERDQAHALDLLGQRLAESLPANAPGAALWDAPPLSMSPLIARDALTDQVIPLLAAAGTVALHGLPGMGKTTLATQLAHHPTLRAHFTDGVLWAGAESPQHTLLRWANLLGLEVLAQDGARESATRVRAAIGLRRMLLVIDDANSPAYSVPRVGGPNCAHLFTTRHAALAIELAGAHTFAVGEVSAHDAQRLLATFAPAIGADPALARFASEAGGMPLALVLIGHHLQRLTKLGQTARARQWLGQASHSQPRHLLELTLPAGGRSDGGTQALSLNALIAQSDQRLPAPAQAALRAFAVLPAKPVTWDEAMALAVIGAALPTAECRDALDTLVEHGLLEVIEERYTMHTLLRAYARGTGTNTAVSAAETAAIHYQISVARSQVLDGAATFRWLATTISLIDSLSSSFDLGLKTLALRIGFSIADASGRLALLEAQLCEAYQALVALKCRILLPRQFLLAKALARTYFVLTRYADAMNYCELALAMRCPVWLRIELQLQKVEILNAMARFDEARTLLKLASNSASTGRAATRTHNSLVLRLAEVATWQGQFQESKQLLAILEQNMIGSPIHETKLLLRIAELHFISAWWERRNNNALSHASTALRLSLEANDLNAEASAHVLLADALIRLSRFDEALLHLDQAMQISDAICSETRLLLATVTRLRLWTALKKDTDARLVALSLLNKAYSPIAHCAIGHAISHWHFAFGRKTRSRFWADRVHRVGIKHSLLHWINDLPQG